MVEVINSQGGAPPADTLARAAELTLEREAAGRQWDVTVQLVSTERMRELNRRFSGEDAVTDVLSFNHTEGWKDGALTGAATAAAVGTDADYLGDIALCVEQARRQAEERGLAPLREMALLTVHGTLHLLGYDHAEDDERRVMFAKTDAILDELFAEAAPQEDARA